MSEQRFFQLPFSFDVTKLEADLQICLQKKWPQHFHTDDYSGSWDSISLRSISGKSDDVFSHPGNDVYRDTELMEQCGYFRFVLSQFQCNTESVRLMQLAPGAVIHEHTDMGGGYADGLLRLHIPVRTHADVDFIVDGNKIPMREGECWYADFSLPHSVNNRSQVSRIHLVVDGVRNEWTDQLFVSCGYDLEAEKKKNQLPARQRKMMIEELLKQDTEISRAMAEAMQRELDNEG